MARASRQQSNWKEDRIISLRNNSEEPQELLKFIISSMPAAKRTDVKSWLRHGQIRVAGTVTTAYNAPVPSGRDVEINLTRPFSVFSHPRMSLVYEDEHILVVNKGYGLLSMGTESSRRDVTAYSILKNYVKKQHPANKIFIVHRLDRDTSGLMMFAKTEEAKTAMQHNWNNMVIARNYVAVLEGNMEEDSGIVKSWLEENSRYEVYSTHEPGRGNLAVTRYKVLARGSGYTLVEFSLDTGRKNQIRVHSKDLGHPIVGDRKYGASSSPIHRLALHARTLRFAHPVTMKDMNFELPVPTRFAGLVKYGILKK